MLPRCTLCFKIDLYKISCYSLKFSEGLFIFLIRFISVFIQFIYTIDIVSIFSLGFMFFLYLLVGNPVLLFASRFVNSRDFWYYVGVVPVFFVSIYILRYRLFDTSLLYLLFFTLFPLLSFLFCLDHSAALPMSSLLFL